ncbi:hypothetical protein CTP10_R64730 (plasmid) [Cupriavidus sp. P-10]|uniref:hypothetical protein n=1 Tax=unclassified Cupriavidus TaxID=2640874 RepID=UPI000E2F69E3|nr:MULTISPECIES: hypothetical protein [unclassified Cupriavidus]BDB29060.1 hypothetical protein CTP10_R64730 [Cupriavidus sp. P-10]
MNHSRIAWVTTNARLVAGAAALFAASILTSANALAALTEEAATAASAPPLYLPASPTNPGGLKGYDHSFQMDLAFEAHSVGKNKAIKDKAKAKKPKTAVSGPKVKSGAYTPAPAPAAEAELQ